MMKGTVNGGREEGEGVGEGNKGREMVGFVRVPDGLPPSCLTGDGTGLTVFLCLSFILE